MPLNGGGTASKPPGTTAVPNTTISSAPFNSVIDDIYAIFNTPRPIAYGGTNGTDITTAQTNLNLVGYSAQTLTEAQKAQARRNINPPYLLKSGNYTVVQDDVGASIRFTATATASLPAALTFGSGGKVTIIADGGAVTIDPNGSETINGALTLIVPNGATATIISDGSNFFMVMKPNEWETVDEITLSAAANYSNTGLSAFRKLRLTGSIHPSVATGLYIQLSASGVFATAASDYSYQSQASQGASSTSAGFITASIGITSAADVAANADSSAVFTATFERFNKANFTRCIGNTAWNNTGGPAVNMWAGQRNSAVVNDGIRIIPGTGTISGYLTIEGIRG